MSKKLFRKNEYGEMGLSGGGLLGLVAVVVVVFVLLLSTVVVSTGHTGVVSTFGRVSENVLQEGFHFKAPWQQVTKVDNRISKIEVATEAFSSDLQTLTVNVAVNYRIDPTKSFYIIKNVGPAYEEVLITPAINEVLKQITAKMTAEQSITNRSKVSSALLEELNTKLNASGIFVSDINIIDFDFSDAYVKAIEEKQVAEQNKLKAQTEQAQITMEKQAEADREIIAAQAALEVAKIDADSVEYAGQKEAAANKAIAESITPELVEYYKVQGWDGKLPQITGSDSIITLQEMNKDEPVEPAQEGE